MPEDYHITAAGVVSPPDEKGISGIKAYQTNLKQAGCHYFCCCCADSTEFYQMDLVHEGKMTRSDIVNYFETQNTACTCFLRILGFLCQFGAFYGILYPLILLVGMIPFVGYVGAVVLIFIAFFCALICFTFIIACAWICARPLLSIALFSIIGIFIVLGKINKDKLPQNAPQEENTTQARILGKFLSL